MVGRPGSRRIPSWDRGPVGLGPRRAHFLRRRCVATGSGSAWKGSRCGRWPASPPPSLSGEGGSAGGCYSPRPPPPRRFPGPREMTCHRAFPSALSGFPLTGCARLRGEGRGRRAPARLPTGPYCPQCGPTASRRRARTTAHDRHQGSAAMSATHPTRLETRTKESNARASQRVPRNPVAQ